MFFKAYSWTSPIDNGLFALVALSFWLADGARPDKFHGQRLVAGIVPMAQINQIWAALNAEVRGAATSFMIVGNNRCYGCGRSRI